MHPTAATPTQAPAAAIHGGPRFNALKRALYSQAILLPGEDAAEFQRRRRALFHSFRPQTIDENRWLLHRTRPLVAAFDAQAAEPESTTAGRVCEPASHTRLHSSMDVGVHRQRLARAVARDRAALYEAQKLRRQGLIPGALKLPPDRYMEVTGEVVQVIEAPRLPTRVCQVADLVPQPAPERGVTPSTDRPNGFREDQQETGAASATGRTAMSARPRRPDSRGRLIGGVGVRRIFLGPRSSRRWARKMWREWQRRRRPRAQGDAPIPNREKLPYTVHST